MELFVSLGVSIVQFVYLCQMREMRIGRRVVSMNGYSLGYDLHVKRQFSKRRMNCQIRME